MSDSPYAPPTAPVLDTADIAGTEAEAIRAQHLRHEVQLKSVGSLYYFAGTLCLIGSLGLLFILSQTSHSALPMELIVVYLVMAPVLLVVGFGYRRLRPWVRIPGTILSVLGLLAIPVGTIINAWILYLIYSAKGQMILSPAYQDLIDATPPMRYRRSAGDWIATAIILGFLAFLVIAVLIGISN